MVLLVQVLIVIIVVGVIYSLWRTTSTYGGLIGSALKWIGIGILIFSIESLDRVLGNLSFVNTLGFSDAEIIHNLLLLLGLLFSAIGFSKLTRVSK